MNTSRTGSWFRNRARLPSDLRTVSTSPSTLTTFPDHVGADTATLPALCSDSLLALRSPWIQ